MTPRARPDIIPEAAFPSDRPQAGVPALRASFGGLVSTPSATPQTSGDIPAGASHAEGTAADQAGLPHPTRRNAVWFTIQCLLRIVFTVWLRYRARGLEHIPRRGGGLFIANHQSFLDPLLIGLPLSRPVSYLARDSLFRVPLIGWILRHTYVVPINREAASSASIKAAVSRMHHGFLVGIFPEGTRSDDGAVGDFKPGFVALVRRAQIPIYPVGIAGAHLALPRRAWLLRPRRVCVVFGEPLTVQQLEELTGRGREDDLVRLVRERVVACQAEAECWRAGIIARTAG